MLYTFSQAHYSETDLQRYLTEITENDAAGAETGICIGDRKKDGRTS